MKTVYGVMSAVILGSILSVASAAQTTVNNSPTTNDFAPLEQWKNAIVAGDATTLKNFYSTDPAADITADGAKSTVEADANFWIGLKARSVKMSLVRVKDRADAHSNIFLAEIDSAATNQVVKITDAIAWKRQGEQWHIVGVERTDAPHLKQPTDMKKDIYPTNVNAHEEIKEAEEKAAAGHKRLLLVFGANWCFDCHVLDLAFHRPDFAPTVQAGYEVVHIDLGDDEKKNADLVQQYEIPLDKGIPALAVADSDGKLIVSQKNGEFEDARSLTPEALLAFLNKWKPEQP